MPSIKFFDRFSTTLSSAYTSGGTSLSLAAIPSGVTATDIWFLKVLGEGSNTEEVFKVTAYSGSGPYTLTVVGAQAGTSASNHANGATVKGSVLAAASLDQLRADMVREMTVSQFDALTSADYKTGDIVRLSNGLYEAVRTASGWSYYYEGRKVTRPPAYSNWTDVNKGTSTFEDRGGAIWMDIQAPSSNWGLRGFAKSHSSGASYEAMFEVPIFMPANYNNCGLAFRESSTGKAVMFALIHLNGWKFTVRKMSDSNTESASYVGEDALVRDPVSQYLKVTDNGTNLIFYRSKDGGRSDNWLQIHSVSRTDFLAGGPDQIWVFGSGFTSAHQNGIFLVHFKQS
jgi:hypothetical protein